MVVLCSRCGIAEVQSDGTRQCLQYQLDVSENSSSSKIDCYYFIEPQMEDGDPLTAKEHLMLKKNELAARKMRGPV